MKLYLSFLKYLKPHWRKLLLATVCGVIYGASSGAGIPAMAKTVLEYVSGGGSQQFKVYGFPNGQHYRVDAIDVKDKFYVVEATDENGEPLDQPPRTITPQKGATPSADRAGADIAAAVGTTEYNVSLMVWLALGMPVLFFIRACFGYASGMLSTRVAVEVATKMQQDVFDKLQAMPMEYFDKHQRGDLQTHLTRDTLMVQASMLDSTPELLRLPFTACSAIGFLVYESLKAHDVVFMASFLIVAPICLIPVTILGRNLRRRAAQQAQNYTQMSQHLWENFGAIQEIRSFSLEEAQKRGFNQKLRTYFASEYKIKKYLQLQQPSMEVVVSVLVSGIFVYAFVQHISIANLTALGAALYMAFDPIKRMGQALNRLHQAEPNGQRLNDFFNMPAGITDPANPRKIERVHGEITFDHMTFAYGATPALSDVSIRIPAGCNCALVGPSGAGKSTFAKLIPRFYEVSQGRVLLDGVDVREVTQADLRRNVAIVSQFPVLFDTSILENIRLGRPGASDEEVIAAARRAHAESFILEFPEGYKTITGDRGDRLSGGQKQRIAIARAFLKNAPVLLLDEATSALDAESEQAVREALIELSKGRTVLTIAHRLSTVRNADLILVFEQGRLVGQGRHEALLASSALYKNLCEKQGLLVP